MSGLDEHKFSVAPMMGWTDRHCRYFHRLLSRHTRLYTEMITADAIVHGDHNYLLQMNNQEHPVALQLGGSDPEQLAKAVKIADGYGYDEFNLNVGCPSDRVQNGRFGACLMKEPERVKDCLAAMNESTERLVSVKCRIGVDDMDDEAGLTHFVDIVKSSSIQHFIIHARKAWLEGLSPKQNREIPPLNYPRVYQLKHSFPDLHIVINGGVETLEQVGAHLQQVDGVMMGRQAYHIPYILARVDQSFYNAPDPIVSRHQVGEAMIPYIESQLAKGVGLYQITRHMLGLFYGQPGARHFRRILSSQVAGSKGDIEVYKTALNSVPQSQDMSLEHSA